MRSCQRRLERSARSLGEFILAERPINADVEQSGGEGSFTYGGTTT
jgi:hypothetical protein